MNPELPYLRKTALFNDKTDEGLKGFNQVKGASEKALKHFNHDESLVEAHSSDLMRRLSIRIASNMAAAWEVWWPKFKCSVAEEFPEPPEGYSSATDFFNAFLTRVIQRNGDPTSDEMLQAEMHKAEYWIIQLVEERCSEPNPEMVPLDYINNPVSMLIRLIDNFRHFGKESLSDPFYKAITEQLNSGFLNLPFIRGLELMGGYEIGGPSRSTSWGALSLALGDFFDGTRNAVDAFNGSYSLDDTSVLMLLISDELLKEFNEEEPNIEVIAKLAERLSSVESNFSRLTREAPVIGTKSLDPLRSKAGGEKTPWHVPLIQELINQTEPGLSWDLIFRRLGSMGRDVPLSEIESINCVDDRLIIMPSDKGRKPVKISRRTLGSPSYKKPPKIKR